MVIFNSYVKLPEGRFIYREKWGHQLVTEGAPLDSLDITGFSARQRKVERWQLWTPHRLSGLGGKHLVLVCPGGTSGSNWWFVLVSHGSMDINRNLILANLKHHWYPLIHESYRMLSLMFLQLCLCWAKIKDLRTTHETSRSYRILAIGKCFKLGRP